jgi:hypothetical protein
MMFHPARSNREHVSPMSFGGLSKRAVSAAAVAPNLLRSRTEGDFHETLKDFWRPESMGDVKP